MAERTGSTRYMSGEYAAYQERYRASMRESDRVLIRLMRMHLDVEKPVRLLDIGCHNGNLLFHLRHEFPHWTLEGGDIFPKVIEACRADPGLSGIKFSNIDVLKLQPDARFDAVVVNAVLFRFEDAEFQKAIRGIVGLLKPRAYFFSFEYYHAFRQSLRIEETTPQHAEGLILHMRSQFQIREMLEDAGCSQASFYPFEIPIDLPLADPADALHTHTRQMPDGTRLQFRGALYQPWCHLVAQRA